MSDQFDKKLVNRINETFDNFEDDSANEGWEALRKRFPGKKKRRAVIWWYSSAAAILLLAGIWLSVNKDIPDNNEQKTAQKMEHNQPEQLIEESATRSSGNKLSEVNSLLPETAITNNRRKATHKTTIHNVVAETPVQSSDKTFASLSSSKSNEDPDAFLADNKNLAEEKSKTDLTILALSPNSSKNTQLDLTLITSAADSSYLNDGLQTAANNTADKEIFPSEISKEQLSKLVQTDTKKERTKTDKNITLSFFAGSYFNYAKGSESSMNTGVGFTSDIKISKRLKLSTGVSLGQNSLKYEELIPQNAASSFASIHQSSLAPNSPNSPNSPALADGKTSMITTPMSYSLNSYDAKLTGFDIPVNLKYTLLERKNTIYLSSGISSNFFINESYTYSFDYQMNGTNTSKTPDEESSTNLQSFDFARVLNFSFGFDHPLNKQTRISFEPFIKYPLSGLGAHDLRFGAAGMNLKLNFNRLK